MGWGGGVGGWGGVGEWVGGVGGGVGGWGGSFRGKHFKNSGNFMNCRENRKKIVTTPVGGARAKPGNQLVFYITRRDNVFSTTTLNTRLV